MKGERIYVSEVGIGECKACGETADLRVGSCFRCSSKIDGRRVASGIDGTTVHELWHVERPDVRWYYSAPALTPAEDSDA